MHSLNNDEQVQHRVAELWKTLLLVLNKDMDYFKMVQILGPGGLEAVYMNLTIPPPTSCYILFIHTIVRSVSINLPQTTSHHNCHIIRTNTK